MLFLLDSTNNKTTYIPHTNSIKHILIDVVCSDDELHNSFKYTDPPTLSLSMCTFFSSNYHSESYLSSPGHARPHYHFSLRPRRGRSIRSRRWTRSLSTHLSTAIRSYGIGGEWCGGLHWWRRWHEGTQIEGGFRRRDGGSVIHDSGDVGCWNVGSIRWW